MTSHNVCKESDHQGERLSENTDELNHGDNGYRHLEPCRHIRPEDILPVVLVARELYDDERTESQEERHGDIASHVSRPWWERNQPHYVTSKDEEEAGQQVGRVLLVALAYSRLDDFIHHIHHEHLNKAYEATRSGVTGLALLVPAGAEQNAAKQDGHIDEHHGNGLRDGEVENRLTRLYYLAAFSPFVAMASP